MAIEIIGLAFPTAGPFLDYLELIQFGPWHPGYTVMHHTGGPDLRTWRGWQTRPRPISDVEWMHNLAEYYGSPPPRGPGDGPWKRGPHFFFTPKNYCVFSPPNARGTHAKSFNANSWGVECVGDFDREPFDGEIRQRYVRGLAALHVAAGLQLLPFERGVRGLHFHRDDPKTSKTCPGNNVDKARLIPEIQAAMDAMTGGDHDNEHVVVAPAPTRPQATIMMDGLNVRVAASAKAPAVRVLDKGAKVTVTSEAMNGSTKWYRIGPDEWVAARYVNL